MTIVRLAGPADEDRLVEFLREHPGRDFFGETDWDRVREHVRLGTEHKGGLHGIIDDDQGGIAASIGIVWDRWWHAKHYGLAVLWLFVRPEYRNRRYERTLNEWAAAMRNAIEDRAGHPVPLISPVMSLTRLDAMIRLWRHYGRMIGAIFQTD